MRPLLAVVVVLARISCSAPQPQNQAPTPAVLTQRCTNEKHGFSVSFPAAWHTNSGEVLPTCTVFDPAPIQLPRDSEIPFDIAITIITVVQPFDPNPLSSRFERVLSVERLNVAGRDAVRLETEATGEGLADRGMRSLRYVVDLGDERVLIASTYDTGATYSGEKTILIRMMETISF